MSTASIVAFIEKRFGPYRKQAVFGTDEFDLSKELQCLYPTLINEYSDYVSNHSLKPIQEYSDVQRDLTGKQQSWKAVFLYGYGQKLGKYDGFFSKTLAFAKGNSRVVNAFFSVLEPGAELPIHTGKYSGLLRAQLCLMSPTSGDFGLEVEGNKVDVPIGQVRIFDDTFPHRAWNRTEQPRVVFIVDFLRPLPFHLHVLNRLGVWLIGRTDYVKGVKRKLK